MQACCVGVGGWRRWVWGFVGGLLGLLGFVGVCWVFVLCGGFLFCVVAVAVGSVRVLVCAFVFA